MLINRRSPIYRFLSLIEGAGDGAEGAGSGGGAAVTFTPEQQAHFDQVLQGRLAQNTRSTAAATEQQIKDYLAEQQAAADLANADEVTRLTAERDQAQAAATAATEAAARTSAETTMRLALIEAGMPTAAVTDGLRLIDIDPSDDEAAVTAKAEALKGRLPALFTTDGAGTPPPPPGITPPRPPAHQGNQTAEQRAAARFKPVYSKPQSAA